MHLTLVPYIAAAGELKTKPTQHSVKELRSIGIQPDILLCRSEQPLPDGERRKIALFTNVPEKAVISAVDLDNIYKIPMWLHAAGPRPDRGRAPAAWATRPSPSRPVRMGSGGRCQPSIRSTKSPSRVVGKYVDHQDAYKSLAEALKHGGLRQRTGCKLKWLESQRGRDSDGGKALRRRRRHPGAGRLRRSRLRRQGADRAVRARARHAVLRHLLRHAGGGGRLRAPRARPGRRQQHRERQAVARIR